MTGRSNDRTGVFSHGYALRLQEKTLAEALKKKGYKTAHFGKWHLNGLKGPGVPILKDDNHSPESFGFDYWISTTNFFDLNPMMSRMGEFVDFKGSSSEIIVNESIKFIEKIHSSESPFFIIIWDVSCVPVCFIISVINNNMPLIPRKCAYERIVREYVLLCS